MVECGVWYGFFARTTLKLFQEREINVLFHLIDLFGQDQTFFKGKGKFNEYSDESILNAVNSRFKNYNVEIHQGLIPDVFNLPSIQSIKKISFLSCDLNGAKAEKDALEFFFPKLAVGGIVYADDYGCQGYEESRKVFDEMLSDTCIPLKTLHSPALFLKIKD
ncbi:macrocin-O-methyltransferase family protein [Synechococcus sp. NOUM97013]|nr:macrocin-O-methyltransferase family protein [Synechococcus sp. NOUM97013]